MPLRSSTADQLGVHERHALGEVALRLPRRAERALEVVHHGQELAHQPAARAFAGRGRLTRRALAVVLEVGLRPAGEVEVLVALATRDRQGIVAPAACSSTLSAASSAAFSPAASFAGSSSPAGSAASSRDVTISSRSVMG